MSVHIGTSGWSYPSGKGKWNGLFYPATRSKRAGTAGFDELRFYSDHFDTVEVNSTFYGQPHADITAGWAARTPARFEFSLKLYQKFTHPKMFRDAALKSAPGSGGPLLDVLAMVTQSDIDDFRTGIEPIAQAGKLGALLAQFPPSFKRTPASVDYLARLLRLFGDYPLAVELRHSSWSDAFGKTVELLNAFGAALVQIDEPKFRLSIRQNALPNITGFYYYPGAVVLIDCLGPRSRGGGLKVNRSNSLRRGTTCGCMAETPPNGGITTRARTATTTSTQPRNSRS